MAVLLGVGRSQLAEPPNKLSRIRWDHPLAVDLAGLWNCRAEPPRNMVNGKHMTATNAAWSPERGAYITTTAGKWEEPDAAVITNGNAFTLAAVFMAPNEGNAKTGIGQRGDGASDNIARIQASNTGLGEIVPGFRDDDGSSFTPTAGSFDVDVLTFVLGVMVRNGTTVAGYCNGRETATSTSATYGNFTGADSAMRTTLAGDGVQTISTQGGTLVAWAWNRALTVDEIARLYDDPWCLFDAREPRYYAIFNSTAATQTVNANVVTDTATVHNPSVSVGSVTVVANVISDAASVLTPSVAPGSVTVNANVITDSASVLNPTVTPGSVTISANLLSDATSVLQPSVSVGSVTIQANLLSDPVSVLEPSVTADSASQTINALLVSDAASVYNPAVTPGSVTITANLVATSASVLQPSVATGSVTITVPLLNATTSVLVPAVIFNQEVTLELLVTTATVRNPAVQRSELFVPDEQTIEFVMVAQTIIFVTVESDIGFVTVAPTLTFVGTDETISFVAPASNLEFQ